ncbi:MAG: ATP-binding protein [Pseudomonadota bacterium]
MIPRRAHEARLRDLLSDSPAVAILGARQVGKTTLARVLAASWPQPVTFLDLENPAHAARLAAPQLALAPLTGLVVLDEIQLRPDLFPLLRVLADRPGTPARFLLLGSASPSLLRDASESLAGRLAFHDLGGLSLQEVGPDRLRDLWVRGGFPRSFLAGSDARSLRWREDFIRTWLERDIPALGLGIPAATLRRLWSMLAHWHGQLLNASELGRSLGVADTTVRRYLDLLQGTFVVHLLQPWRANLGKRQVKSPRIYLTDPGLLHAFFGVADHAALLGHPKTGASWEGFGIATVLDLLGVRPGEAFFWRTQDGAELDLLVTRGGRRRGFEFKLTAAPSTTRSMHIALSDLELDDLTVIHAGEGCFPMADRIRAVALADAPEALASP